MWKWFVNDNVCFLIVDVFIFSLEIYWNGFIERLF